MSLSRDVVLIWRAMQVWMKNSYFSHFPMPQINKEAQEKNNFWGHTIEIDIANIFIVLNLL